MSDIRRRVGRLERQLQGGPGPCRTCADRPPGRVVLYEPRPDGAEVPAPPPPICPECGAVRQGVCIMLPDNGRESP